MKNLADRYSDDRVQIGICQDAQSADLIQERNRLKTAVELIEGAAKGDISPTGEYFLTSSELLHLNESIAAESIRMETVLKAADFNHLDKTKVSMLIESVYVHKRDPKSGTQAIDITWKF